MPFDAFLDQLLQFLPPPHDGIILPEDKRYPQARKVWNDCIDRYPCIIIQPRGVTDIAAVLKCCADHKLVLTVRGGGHSVCGHSIRDGAVLLDLSAHMRNVLVDPITRLVHVGGGATWNDVDRETGPYGMSVPTGLISHTGVGGLTLGGGLGWLSRQGGLTCDALESVLLVTASGDAMRLSAESKGREATLWFALRGGGQGLGVAVEFVFHAVKTKEAHIMRIEFPMPITAARPKTFLKAYQQATRDLPREVSLFCFIVRGCFLMEAVGTIPFEQWEKHMMPLLTADPGRVLRRTTTIAAQNAAYDSGNRWGRCYRWSRSTFLAADLQLETLWEKVISPTLAAADELPLTLMHLGGKIAEVPEDASAFRHRLCPLEMHAIWSWPTEDAEFAAQAARCAADYGTRIAPFGGNSYANTDGTDTVERAAAVYGPHLQRLRQAKAIADPLGLLYSPYALSQKIAELQMNAKSDGNLDPAALRLYLVPKPEPSALAP